MSFLGLYKIAVLCNLLVPVYIIVIILYILSVCVTVCAELKYGSGIYCHRLYFFNLFFQ